MDIFARITKIDEARREIHGVMAEEAPDKAGEIFDYDSSKPYVQAWSDEAVKRTALAGQDISFGNVRSQHNPKVVAGKLVAIDFDDKARKIPVIARIVDDAEWEKVQQGLYTGFSIGGDYVKRWSDGNKVRYTARPKEVSIVDSPCMEGATFTMVKANGAVETRQFHTTALGAILAQIEELRKSIDNGADADPSPAFTPRHRDGSPVPITDPRPMEILHKALTRRLTSHQLEKQQARSGRFVPRP